MIAQVASEKTMKTITSMMIQGMVQTALRSVE